MRLKLSIVEPLEYGVYPTVPHCRTEEEFCYYVIAFSSCFHFILRHIKIQRNLLAQETGILRMGRE